MNVLKRLTLAREVNRTGVFSLWAYMSNYVQALFAPYRQVGSGGKHWEGLG